MRDKPGPDAKALRNPGYSIQRAYALEEQQGRVRKLGSA